MKQKLFTISYLLLLFSTLSIAQTNSKIYKKGWNDLNKNGKMDVYENPNAPIDKRVEDLLSQMTMDEKTCQFGTIYGYKRVIKDIHPTEDWKKRIWKDGAGNLDEHMNGRAGIKPYLGFKEHAELMNEIQAWFLEETRLGIPVDFTCEGIRGVGYINASNFPNQTGIGATWDLDLVQRVGMVTGKEGKAVGYTNVYSPILDVSRDPRWGRAVECYGEDPYLVGEMGKAQVNGIQSAGMASTVKHFAAYSTPSGGRDGGCRTDPQVPFRDMHELLLAPFRKVFTETDVMGTMSSLNTYDGVPVTGSHYFLTELLRNQYGFKGYVVSDSGADFWQYTKHKTEPTVVDAIAKAYNAGLNVRTDFKSMEDLVQPLRDALKQGKVTEETVNARVADVLRVKFKLGLFDTPFVDADKAESIVHNKEHEAITLEAARKSIVLLKNQDNALPLDAKKIKTLLVTGPNANNIKPMISKYGPGLSKVITPLKGIKARLGKEVDVLYAKGCDHVDAMFPKSDVMHIAPNKEELAELNEAKEKAKLADAIVVVVGDDHFTTGEAHSRTSLNLPGHQSLLIQEMVKSGKPVTVVLMIGRAASINWTDQYVPGIMVSWFGGEKVGKAVAETLFGDYNPGGKLPVTFPSTVGQLPMAFPYRVKAWGGQSKKNDPNGWGQTRLVNPLYHFGHGLSYTTFEYNDLKISPANPSVNDTITISCTVKNTGNRDGDEVVQLYLRDQIASVSPFDQLLRGFERVTLKKGESRKVTFTINPKRDLEMLGLDNTWIVEPGVFEVGVGASSVDIKLKGEFNLR
ncbi:glycoside hydrolase family 3 N-terminal domain-containing protein [Jejuia pallidilutea]|nr:glycoside hydrolase family 3 N-terminal domain-containing protein [Jejuia pallidilutea]